MTLTSTFSDAWAEYESLGESGAIRIGAVPVAQPNHRREPLPAVSLEDFYAYMPMHQYLFVPTRELWPAASVNARCPPPKNADGTRATRTVQRKGKNGVMEWEEVPISVTDWLDQNCAIDMMTWAPGEPMIIRDRLYPMAG